MNVEGERMDRAEYDLRTEFIQVMMRFKKLRGFIHSRQNLNMSEALILHSIGAGMMAAGHQDCTTRIQDKLHISKPAISQNLTALEEKGLITRRVSQSDRRRFDFELSEKGVAFAELMRADADARMGELISRMGEEDTRVLLRLLRKMIEVIEGIAREQEQAAQEQAAQEPTPASPPPPPPEQTPPTQAAPESPSSCLDESECIC
jgi:DNA-binding MarR family transcriptional regulator